jgi:hypothetical protein
MPLLLVLLPSGISPQPAKASPDWWNPAWSCRKAITITELSDSALVDYQVKIDLDYEPTMQANFGDLRFINAADNLLDYWIESKTDGASATVWVEVDDIEASTDTTIYMYYGNPAASSASDGSATFDFFDDFSGDLSKWTIDPENADNKVYIYNGALRHDPDSSQTKNSYYDTRIRTAAYKILDGVIEYSVYLAGSTSSSPRIIHQLGFRVQSLNFENGYCWRLQNSAADGGHLRFTGIASWTTFGTAYPATTGNVWHTVKEVVSSSNYTGYVDGGSAYSGTNNTKLTADYLVSHVHGVSLNASSYVLVDNIRVRQYVSPEPTCIIGPEECNSPPDPPSDLGPAEYVDSSWVDDNTPTLEFTQSDPDGNTVSYTIQIDDDDDFSSVAVDYTSGLMAQGDASFNVGQADGGGTYTEGYEGQTLDDGDYYWRVMSTDEHGFIGGWTEANGGAIAFRLNTATETGHTLKDKYHTHEDATVSGSGFTPNSKVAVYVVEEGKWLGGETIADYGIVAQKTFDVDGDGEISGTVWKAPLELGEYDVAFDADRNGVYDEILDFVDNPNHPGFIVVLSTVGGEVYPTDKAALLLPWLIAGAALILTTGGLILLRLRSR